MRPVQGPQLLGPGADEKQDHHVRAHRLIGLGRRQLGPAGHRDDPAFAIAVKPAETRPVPRCLDSLHDRPPSPRLGRSVTTRPHLTSLSSSAT